MYRRIKLTKGKYAIVDADDYEWLSQWNWCLSNGYAIRAAHDNEGRKFHLSMHRQIMNLINREKVTVDHRNRRTLDNRRQNLRICRHKDNIRNKKLQCNNTTGYKGVVYHAGGYAAQIKVDGKNIYLGRKPTAKEASRLYMEAANKYYGDFARVR